MKSRHHGVSSEAAVSPLREPAEHVSSFGDGNENTFIHTICIEFCLLRSQLFHTIEHGILDTCIVLLGERGLIEYIKKKPMQ